MLKGIPKIISPELIKILMEMGHGDEIVLADGNFPAASNAERLIRCDGHGVPELLEAILKFFPLDTYSDHSVSLMQVVEGDATQPKIWDDYCAVIQKYDSHFSSFKMVERFDFYERSKKAYAIVATGENALYANIMLKKGVVVDG
ncbi:L-fucose mutarotase [Neobacillus mesonae]|uniref:L-fucose mutarotase n=1 Tax=Neobacillus mesonae TaxID=1193713 RepID=UPI002572AF0B|nr:L-fucose mutarotase [Neobacillus mesonae]MED4204743.1 L-fucose mutarotase [Neobacillus mesonae]